MATKNNDAKMWENKDKRELCVRVYNSSVIQGIEHEEALKRAISVVDKVFETYCEKVEEGEEETNIKPL